MVIEVLVLLRCPFAISTDNVSPCVRRAAVAGGLPQWSSAGVQGCCTGVGSQSGVACCRHQYRALQVSNSCWLALCEPCLYFSGSWRVWSLVWTNRGTSPAAILALTQPSSPPPRSRLTDGWTTRSVGVACCVVSLLCRSWTGRWLLSRAPSLRHREVRLSVCEQRAECAFHQRVVPLRSSW